MPFPTVKDNQFVRAAKQFPAASAGVAANAAQKASLLSYTDITGGLPEAGMPLNLTFREFVVCAPAATMDSATMNSIITDARLGDEARVFIKSAAGNTYWSSYQRWVATSATAAGVVTWTQSI